jgi:hypothetical protein
LWVAVRDTDGINPRVKCVQLFGKTFGNEIAEAGQQVFCVDNREGRSKHR